MGYERSKLKLKFEDEEFDGLTVRMKRLPIGDLFAVTELAELGEGVKESKEAFDTLLTQLADGLISWNLEEDGVPVPAVKGHPAHVATSGCCDPSEASCGLVCADPDARHTSTGLYSLDIDLVMAIVSAWVDAASGVSPPLPKNSNSGGLSLAESEAMEALSVNLGSLPTPA